MQIIKFLRLVLLLFVMVLSNGCCDKEIIEPERPTNIQGWKSYPLGSITIYGRFILQKGESTDNGKVGIRLVELYPAKCRIAQITQIPSAKMQIYNVSDNSILCERRFVLFANRLDILDTCSEKLKGLEWDVIYIESINFKEGWAAFELR